MLFYLVLSAMILFTSYYLYRDIKNKINTGNTFAEGFNGNNSSAPKGYKYTGESQCQDWNKNYVVCQTALDGKNCGIKATTKKECAAECDKRDSCGEMYFKNGVCYLANGKCVPQTNPKNPQPHYKKIKQDNNSIKQDNNSIKQDNNSIKQDNNSSTCLQPPPATVDANKCISPDQISWGSKMMNMLNGLAGKSKCIDSAALKKVTENAGPDLILAFGAANKHLRQAKPYIDAALKDAQPYLTNAFSKSQTHMGSVFVNPVTNNASAQNNVNTSAQNNVNASAQNNNDNAPAQNKEPETLEKANEIIESAELPTQGTNSDEINSKIIENNNNIPEQQKNKMTDKFFKMPNGNLLLPAKGQCPNGCKPSVYDNDTCSNQIFMDKEYRNCPWVDEKGNSQSCQGCGAVLLPKNKYGYARTRPGLFSQKSVKNILEQNNFSPDNDGSSVDPGNNISVGKDFMNELSVQKRFDLPQISDSEYQQLGKLVQKYQLDGSDSISGKFNLTNAINSLLNTNPLASNLLENKGDSDQSDGEKSNNIGTNQPYQKNIMDSYKKKKVNSGDSAIYNSAYTTTYRPSNPRKGVNPYNSLWGSI